MSIKVGLPPGLPFISIIELTLRLPSFSWTYRTFRKDWYRDHFCQHEHRPRDAIRSQVPTQRSKATYTAFSGERGRPKCRSDRWSQRMSELWWIGSLDLKLSKVGRYTKETAGKPEDQLLRWRRILLVSCSAFLPKFRQILHQAKFTEVAKWSCCCVIY